MADQRQCHEQECPDKICREQQSLSGEPVAHIPGDGGEKQHGERKGDAHRSECAEFPGAQQGKKADDGHVPEPVANLRDPVGGG